MRDRTPGSDAASHEGGHLSGCPPVSTSVLCAPAA